MKFVIVSLSTIGTSRPRSDHDPNCANVFRILCNLDAKSKTTLISTCHNNLSADLVVVNMCDDTITITVCKLDWECLECMPLRHVVLNPMLELCCGKVTSTDTLKLVIS